MPSPHPSRLDRLHGSASANAEILFARSVSPLGTLTYRSRAVAPLSQLELYRLLHAAQQRNHAEQLTGLLVYDEGCFLQTLEGPLDNLARVWASIRRDPRHTAIEVLCDHPTVARFFPDWDLRLARPEPGAVPASALPVPGMPAPFALAPETIASLRERPEAAPALMTTLSLVPVAPVPEPEPSPDPADAARDAGRLLLGHVVDEIVVPRLNALHAQRQSALPPAHPRTAELVALLVTADAAPGFALVRSLMRAADGRRAAGGFGPLCASLFEPVARALGDRWAADDCSEHELTLALGRLQGAIRRGSGLTDERRFPAAPAARMPAVLVVPQPGETHGLGAALDAELLWRAGWNLHTDFPATDAALDGLLAGHWYDALDLTLSTTFRREHWLARLARTIAHARAASRNPAIVIVVGGRVFSENREHGEAPDPHADATCASAMQIEATLHAAMQRRH